MADGTVTIRQGDMRPIYGGVRAATGQTVRLTSAPQWTLEDASGATVQSGPVTGYTMGSLAEVEAWATVSAASLNPGFYRLTFEFNLMSSDGIARVMHPVVTVIVECA